MAGICTRFTNCFSSYWAQTPQAKVDRELFLSNQLLRINRALGNSRLGANVIRGISVLSPIILRAIQLELASYFLPSLFTKVIAAGYIIESSYKFYQAYQNKGIFGSRTGSIERFQPERQMNFDENVQKLEDLIFEYYLENHRDIALIHLHELETAFHLLPPSERILTRRNKLKVLREIITKAEVTPISYSLYSRMALTRLMKQGVTPENRAICSRLEKYYTEHSMLRNSTRRKVLQYFIDHATDDFHYSRRYSSETGEVEAYIPDLTAENFFSHLHKFRNYADMNLHQSSNPKSALSLIIRRYQIMTQFWHFYRDNQVDFAHLEKFLEQYMLDCSKCLLSQHSELLERHPEVSNHNNSNHSEEHIESGREMDFEFLGSIGR